MNLPSSLIQTAQDTIDSLNDDLANPDSPSHGQFTAVSRRADGLVQLQFSRVSGLTYIIEASSDLQT
jgi:hypothetical protein